MSGGDGRDARCCNSSIGTHPAPPLQQPLSCPSPGVGSKHPAVALLCQALQQKKKSKSFSKTPHTLFSLPIFPFVAVQFPPKASSPAAEGRHPTARGCGVLWPFPSPDN